MTVATLNKTIDVACSVWSPRESAVRPSVLTRFELENPPRFIKLPHTHAAHAPQLLCCSKLFPQTQPQPSQPLKRPSWLFIWWPLVTVRLSRMEFYIITLVLWIRIKQRSELTCPHLFLYSSACVEIHFGSFMLGFFSYSFGSYYEWHMTWVGMSLPLTLR